MSGGDLQKRVEPLSQLLNIAAGTVGIQTSQHFILTHLRKPQAVRCSSKPPKIQRVELRMYRRTRTSSGLGKIGEVLEIESDRKAIQRRTVSWVCDYCLVFCPHPLMLIVNDLRRNTHASTSFCLHDSMSMARSQGLRRSQAVNFTVSHQVHGE